MKKKIKKYMSGCMIASLLLTAMPLQIVPGAEADSKGEKKQEISSNESGSAKNNLGGIYDGNDAIVEEVPESDDDIEAPVADGKETSDTIWGPEDLEVEDRANESSDLEDITDEFTDPVFRSEIRSVLGLSEDAVITRSACAKITSLELSYTSTSIKSLEGIKNLTNLTELDCSENQLTSLDVSNCTNLTKLNCSENQLTSLDISGCTSLTELGCNDNPLTSLDISSCINLTELVCHQNFLTSLDVSGCTNLTELDC